MRIALFSGAALALFVSMAHAADTDGAADPGIVVTGERLPPDAKPAPNTRADITAAQVAETVNAVNVEDALRYAPDILVRKRHPGDTQDPITTRTSGVGASARSLIYADDVLLSALIGNNNSAASPRFGLVAPDEITRVEVLYGPFAAAYPGNSIGAVVNIVTRMPDRFEASLDVLGSAQSFIKYGTKDTYPTGQVSAVVGDKVGPWSFWLSEAHTDTRGQPLAFATLARPANPSAAGTPVTGAYTDANRTGAPIVVLGGTGLEHQVQDTAKVKVAYDLPGGAQAIYSLGYFGQSDHAGADSYLTNAAGAPVYAGALNINGYAYNVPASAFDGNVYHLDERHFANSLVVRSAPSNAFTWKAVASAYTYAHDVQRAPTTALPGGNSAGTAGTISRLDGTGWETLDLRAGWKPPLHLFGAAQSLSFGAHGDSFHFDNPKYTTTDWVSNGAATLASRAKGRTQTTALWGQDAIALTPALTATLGLRVEHWRAFDGLNYSVAPALNVVQPKLEANKSSPKASLDWRPDSAWTLSARYGAAYRFPTVTELYQAVTTGPILTSPNPNLKPEAAKSYELSATRTVMGGSVRLSLFEEHIANALISQSAPLVTGSTTLYSYVQNIPKVRSRGAEIVAEGLHLSPQWEVGGSITYVDARTISDPIFLAAQGKRLPQLPRLRATLVTTWRPAPNWSATIAGRYAGREYGTIDNSDPYANTYQGFSAFFVADARVRWQVTPKWAVAVGSENLLNRKYFLFHPFPQRTAFLEVKANY